MFGKHILGVVILSLRVIFSLIVDCPSGFLRTDLPSLNRPNLRLTTYNAYFLFNRTTRLTPWRNQQELDEHVSRLAAVLRDIQPDIVNLCEVGSCEVVNGLRSQVFIVPADSYLIKGTDTYTGQNNALITTIAPGADLWRTEERSDFPQSPSDCDYVHEPKSYGVSKHYFTTFRVESVGLEASDPPVMILLASVHFKAIPNDSSSCSRREAQARVIKSEVQRWLGEQASSGDRLFVIILGDFNDYDGSILDCAGDVPNSHVVAGLKEALGLESASGLLSQEDRFSYWWKTHDSRSMLDHVLVSTELFDCCVKSVRINTELYPSGNYNISDHWPVTVDFDFLPLFLRERRSSGIIVGVALGVCGVVALFQCLAWALVLGICLLRRQRTYEVVEDEEDELVGLSQDSRKFLR